VKAAVIVFPGSNRDRDMLMALERAAGRPPLAVWHGEADFEPVDLIVVPGGFSYGDYLRAGAMAVHSPIMREVAKRARAGVPLLGVCNGFQILTEAGLLPGALLRNARLKFVCRDIHMKVETAQSLFTAGYENGQVIRVPVAHHDGIYNETKTVLGLMPHPENATDPQLGGTDGAALFDGLVAALH
jgi:phosphoribosylformylglycinamidine synthase I